MLEDEVEVSRGNMLVSPDARPQVADQFAANIVWFDEHALLPGRSYILRTETDQASATVTDLKYRINVNNFAHEAAKSARHERGRRLQHLDAGADRLRHASPTTAPPAPSS